jgi:hypothetical protein
MIKIYCLVDPFTEIPFYVGATKLPLKQRLKQHIQLSLKYKEWMNCTHNELKHFPLQRRSVFINLLLNSNREPNIIELFQCSALAANYYEKFFYCFLQKSGFYLHQDNMRFNYNSVNIRHSNRCKSLILFNKNSSSNIWYL